jgi:hypothetical protein
LETNQNIPSFIYLKYDSMFCKTPHGMVICPQFGYCARRDGVDRLACLLLLGRGERQYVLFLVGLQESSHVDTSDD